MLLCLEAGPVEFCQELQWPERPQVAACLPALVSKKLGPEPQAATLGRELCGACTASPFWE